MVDLFVLLLQDLQRSLGHESEGGIHIQQAGMNHGVF